MRNRVILALAVCLAAVLLAGCGVAKFDDSSGFRDPFSSSSRRTDYVPNEEITAINNLHNELVQLYNEGADIMYKALEDGIEMEEGLEENYRAMADTIRTHTKEMEEKLIDMTEAEGAVFRKKLEDTKADILALREALDKALEGA